MSEVDNPATSGDGGNAGVVELLYRLDSVEPTRAPDGSDEAWHRYVIAQGKNQIVGMRPGTRSVLYPLLEEMVARLNERAGKQRAKAAK